jgi:hypothetical protein
MNSRRVSSGHKLGQLIGDWFEEYFVLPLLKTVANELHLFIDSRFIKRTVRGSKMNGLIVMETALIMIMCLNYTVVKTKLVFRLPL